MSKNIIWYFDFISPFAYLQQARFSEFPAEVSIQARPVLFAGLLNHWENKGPAEIPSKRIFTYQHVLWLAQKNDIPLSMPPKHPFIPLKALRLAIALDNDLSVIGKIFNYIWRDGFDIDDDARWSALLDKLGVENPEKTINQSRIKQQLRENTEQAISQGVFGVPTILATCHSSEMNNGATCHSSEMNNGATCHSSEMNNGADTHLFWGFDATDMYLQYLQDPTWLDDPEMQAMDMIPEAAIRVKT